MNHDEFCPISNTQCPPSILGQHTIMLENSEDVWLCDTCMQECFCSALKKARESEREKILTEVSIMNCRVHDYEDGMCHVAIDDLMKMLETP